MLKGKYFADFKQNNLNVYVLDTKVNLNHPEFLYLAERTDLGGFNGINNHGSHVAAIILGESIGVIRDPETRLYSYGVCNRFGQCPEAFIVAGLVAVLKHLDMNYHRRGVINMSLGGRCVIFGVDFCSKPIKRAIDNLRNHESCPVIVVSAGNSNADACNFQPARYQEVITVASYNINARRSVFSNFGPCIDAWGPGERIRSAFWFGYGVLSGTSMASPAIAGIVGAWILICPRIEFEEIKDRLQCSGIFEDNCPWMAPNPVIDARSPNDRRFCFDCDKVHTMFYCKKSQPKKYWWGVPQIPIPTRSPTRSPTNSPTNSPTVSPTNTSKGSWWTTSPTSKPISLPIDGPTLRPTFRLVDICSKCPGGCLDPNDLTCYPRYPSGDCHPTTIPCNPEFNQDSPWFGALKDKASQINNIINQHKSTYYFSIISLLIGCILGVFIILLFTSCKCPFN